MHVPSTPFPAGIRKWHHRWKHRRGPQPLRDVADLRCQNDQEACSNQKLVRIGSHSRTDSTYQSKLWLISCGMISSRSEHSVKLRYLTSSKGLSRILASSIITKTNSMPLCIPLLILRKVQSPHKSLWDCCLKKIDSTADLKASTNPHSLDTRGLLVTSSPRPNSHVLLCRRAVRAWRSAGEACSTEAQTSKTRGGW